MDSIEEPGHDFCSLGIHAADTVMMDASAIKYMRHVAAVFS